MVFGRVIVLKKIVKLLRILTLPAFQKDATNDYFSEISGSTIIFFISNPFIFVTRNACSSFYLSRKAIINFSVF